MKQKERREGGQKVKAIEKEKEKKEKKIGGWGIEKKKEKKGESRRRGNTK